MAVPVGFGPRGRAGRPSLAKWQHGDVQQLPLLRAAPAPRPAGSVRIPAAVSPGSAEENRAGGISTSGPVGAGSVLDPIQRVQRAGAGGDGATREEKTGLSAGFPERYLLLLKINDALERFRFVSLTARPLRQPGRRIQHRSQSW